VESPNPPDINDIAPLAALPDGSSLEKVIRYESHLQRQLDKALAALRLLQRNRRMRKQKIRFVLLAAENEKCETNSSTMRRIQSPALPLLPAPTERVDFLDSKSRSQTRIDNHD
jgi:hypothetical protein